MSAPAPLRAEDPEWLGCYRLAGRLGRGGQGVVLLGTSPDGSRVAVKLMHWRLDEEKARRRFVGEVEAVRRVAPFCTAQVLEADLDGDRPYIVSEYVDGVSLQEHITAEGPRRGGSLDRVAVGTATALAAIHGAGVVHRDFKPGNVLLGLDGPRVIDFGISRMMDTTATMGRVPVGTPAYISPEQLKGQRAGPSADMFSWGLTVAFTASGRHAYAAESFEAILGRILFGKADLDPLTGPLREIVVACLAEDPAERPSAEEVLRRLIGHGAISLPARSPGEVLETGATLASEPQAGEDDGPTTLSFESETDHDDGPTTLTFTPEAGHHDGAATIAPPPADSSREGAESLPGPRVRARLSRWPALVAAAALVVAGTVGVMLWRWHFAPAWNTSTGRSGAGFSYAGRWTGSAEQPTAGRVFAVEIRLTDVTTRGAMKWGADLHCSGRLTRLDRKATTLTFQLDQVRGDRCHPGTVEISPRGSDQMTFHVTRPEEQSARYSGTVARSS
jgi:serine/threonine protein kinase